MRMRLAPDFTCTKRLGLLDRNASAQFLISKTRAICCCAFDPGLIKYEYASIAHHRLSSRSY